jgi:hypothetical protein
MISPLLAQYAPGVDWKKIETEHFTIIFPAEISDQAAKVSGKIDLLYEMDAMAYEDVRQFKWPIILTNAGMNPNGYVSMAPRKSNWYGTPIAENISTLDWYDTLGIHETRHMVQFDRLNSRLNHLLYILMGESGLSLGINLGVPDWFFEGDAVAAETAFTDTGRGRDPLFYQGMLDVVTEQDYSYQKMVNGSYRDSIPSHYPMGYFLTSYVKNEYGEDSWDGILDSATLLPIPAFGMYLGAKKVSGLSWTTLYKEMTDDLKSKWEEQVSRVELIENTVLTDQELKDPVWWEALSLENGRVLARKTSLAKPAVLVEISEEGEKELLRVPEYASIHAAGNKVVWTYLRPSTLHPAVSWSDLVTLNLETGKKTYLTKGERYLMPVLSHGADRIAAVEWTKERRANMVFLDEMSAEVLASYELPEGYFPANPAWSEDESILYFTVQSEEGRAIAGIHTNSGEFFLVTDFSMESIKTVRPWGDYILYSSERSGFENIMAVNLSSKEIYQVSSRVNGTVKPFTGVYGGESVLLYGEFATGGVLRLVLQELNPEKWISEENMNPQPFVYYGDKGHVEGPADWNLDRVNAEAKVYTEKDIQDFSLAGSKFNVHSWGLGRSESYDSRLQIYVKSTDLMGTMNWTLGGEYDTNENSPGAFFNMTWSQFYPNISWNNSYMYREIDSDKAHDLSSGLTLSFPFNLSRDIWYHELTPYAGSSIQYLIPSGSGDDGDLTAPVNYGLDWISALPGSSRSLNPLLGFSEKLYFEHNPLQDENYFLSSRSTLYLPGGIRNTSLALTGTYENQTGGYSSRVLFSRGYKALSMDQLYQIKGSYSFPIVYPDLALGSFAYVKRLRGNLFYDYTGLNDTIADPQTFQSVGMEFSMDFTALNFKHMPLDIGVRFSWLIEEEKPVIEFMLMDLGF